MAKDRELPSKEASLFRTMIRHYEQKQYKKGVKAADTVLKKVPNHGETLCMKGLLLNSLDRKDEAYALVRRGLQNDLTSHVCWHVYGLLHRSDKNYEEAAKCYLNALKYDKENQQILRDLAVIQIQVRNYKGFKETRRQLLQLKPTLRSNWTALAVAHHMLAEYEAAEKLLTSYEDTLKSPPAKDDMEHSEALLYKNAIIAESGNLDGALTHLDVIEPLVLDKLSVHESRARIYLRQERYEEAKTAYQRLLRRNGESYAYFAAYEQCVGRDKCGAVDMGALQKAYEELEDHFPASDAAKRLALNFLKGDVFERKLKAYLTHHLDRGVPSTFSNIKGLYTSPQRADAILAIATSRLHSPPTNGQVNGSSSSPWTLYFISQHYDHFRDTTNALKYIDQAIDSFDEGAVPLELLLSKARMYKHAGDLSTATSLMQKVRATDLKDRYINTKAAKYLLRKDEYDKAVELLGLFTRNEAKGGAVGDLHDMQCHWFLVESAESFRRTKRPWLALKRYHAIKKVFDDWWDDQHDFHTYSLRKGPIRVYIDMLKWEDGLCNMPYYVRAAIGAIETYIDLFDHPGSAYQTNGSAWEDLSDTQRKKIIKSQKRDDANEEGFALSQTEKPLEDAKVFLAPMQQQAPGLLATHRLTFELAIRQKDYTAALGALRHGYRLDARDADLHVQVARFRLALDQAQAGSGAGAGAEGVADLRAGLEEILPTSLSYQAWNDQFGSENKDPPHVLASLRARQLAQPIHDPEVSTLFACLAQQTLPQTITALHFLSSCKSPRRDEYRQKASQKFAYARAFL